MRKLLFLLLFSATAMAGPAVIFNGQYAKALKDKFKFKTTTVEIDSTGNNFGVNTPSTFGGNLGLTGNLNITGDINNTGDIIPATDSLYGLGSALLRFENAYLETVTISDLVSDGKIEVTSTTQSSIPCPLMTKSEKEAIVSPADGSCVYDTDDDAEYHYNTTLAQWVFAGGIVEVDNMTDPIAFTPTGTWDNTTYTGSWERQGKFAIIKFKALATGTPTNSIALDFDFSSTGLVMDTSDPSFLSTTVAQTVLGTGALVDNGSNTYYVDAFYDTTTTFKIRTKTADLNHVASTNPTYSILLAPFTVVSGDFVEVTARVPIVGWEASSKYATGSCDGLACFNTFSARIDGISATPATLSESINWIDTITDVGAGDYTLNFVSGLVTVAPSCECSARGAGVGGWNAHCQVDATSTTLVNVTIADASSKIDNDFDIICQRQGADFFDHDERFIPISNQENVYSAHVSSTGTVNSESSDFMPM